MSTNPFDAAAPPAPQGLERAGEAWPFLKTVAVFFQAIGEGLAAHRRYQMLVTRGVPPDKAVGIAFDATFGKRRCG
jgi:hypothetical protein